MDTAELITAIVAAVVVIGYLLYQLGFFDG
jgi:hypothetical protein